MISRLHPNFRKAFQGLPKEVQERAREAYRRFRENPGHPSLRFKPLHSDLPLWSVRIDDSHRAVGVRKDDGAIIWFFIGSHDQYEKLLRTI